MVFRMLGELQVVDGDVDVPIRGAKQRMLLLLLLVRARETVQAERLADELWGDDPPAGGANALQALVSKLRRALGPLSDTLTTGAGGYRLDAADDEIDARCFEAAAQRGRDALAAGAVEAAARELGDALDLWRGPPLDGDDDSDPLRREAVRLEELRWAVLEDRIDANLRQGHHAKLVAELEQRIGEAPLRERLHGFLMLALYRAGRQAEALRAYQHARDVLGEELGLDPGPDLQALESAILAHDPTLDMEPQVRTLPAKRRSNLTPSLSSFVGRVADLEALQGLVDEHRLVTVVGPGGAGKTRLAHEMAGRWCDRADVWMVELAALRDPGAVIDAFVLALGVPDGSRPGLDRVADHIASRNTVLVLDNCEHVISEAARVTEHLLLACPELRVVATSREAIGIGGEALWPVPRMSGDDAAALFVDRATAVGGFDPAAEPEQAIDEVCTRLDGLPLAIELAAARTRAIPVQQLVTRLDDRFRLLTGGTRTAMPRQQTLRAVVEWSYDLLFTDEQQVFARLTVFGGGCTLEAAEAVCAGGDIDASDVAEVLARLVDKSLVIADRGGGQVRFSLLQTLMLYGRERLAASEDASSTRARHAAHFRAHCAAGLEAFRGVDQVGWFTRSRREVDNVRVALAWAIEQHDPDSALEMAGGVAWTHWLSGSGDEGIRLLDAALACPGEPAIDLRATALTWECTVRSNAGTGLDRALELGEQSLDLWREVGDERRLAEASVMIAGVHVMRGNRERAVELFDQAQAFFDPHDDHLSQAIALSARGRIAMFRGDFEAAARLQHASVAEFEAAGVLWAMASVYSDLANLLEVQGDLRAAEAATERALEAARALDLHLAAAQLLARLGNLAMLQGDGERAELRHDQALALAEEAGATLSTAFTLNWRSVARRRAGRLDDACDAAEAALEVYRAAGSPIGVARALANLGFVAELRGDLPEAERLHREGLATAAAHLDGRDVAYALQGLAGVAVADGDGARAAALLGHAAAVASTGSALWTVSASEADRIAAGAMALVGADAFTAAYERGASASTDTLVEPSATPRRDTWATLG